jgi:hypothetical protein
MYYGKDDDRYQEKSYKPYTQPFQNVQTHGSAFIKQMKPLQASQAAARRRPAN